MTSDQETGPVLRLCYDLGVEDVARLSGGEVNGPHSSLVFLNGSIVGATGRVSVSRLSRPRPAALRRGGSAASSPV